MDYFALFGLVPHFVLDRVALDAAFRAMQAEVHPDKFASADAAVQRQAMERATLVNAAYQTLKSPVARGRYLLQQQGIEAFDPANTQMSSAFLMQQIAWREQLETAQERADAAALDHLEAEIAVAAQQHEARLAALLDERHDHLHATETLRELRFIEKLAEEIHAAFDTLDG